MHQLTELKLSDLSDVDIYIEGNELIVEFDLDDEELVLKFDPKFEFQNGNEFIATDDTEAYVGLNPDNILVMILHNLVEKRVVTLNLIFTDDGCHYEDMKLLKISEVH